MKMTKAVKTYPVQTGGNTTQLVLMVGWVFQSEEKTNTITSTLNLCKTRSPTKTLLYLSPRSN